MNLKTSVSLDELCKESYVLKLTLTLLLNEEFVLKERDILEKANSTKSMFLIPKNEPGLKN